MLLYTFTDFISLKKYESLSQRKLYRNNDEYFQIKIMQGQK